MITAQDAFRVLGIEVSTEDELDRIDETVVKRQYRKLALKLHPDKNRDDANAQQKFNQLKIVYDMMMSESKRFEFIQMIRASLQRKIERAEKDVDKRRLAEDLERRESEWASVQSEKADSRAMRARHRYLIEELQAKRDEAKRQSGRFSSTVTGGPDDSNMSLEYWINFGLNEDLETRRQKMERFSNFISKKLG